MGLLFQEFYLCDAQHVAAAGRTGCCTAQLHDVAEGIARSALVQHLDSIFIGSGCLAELHAHISEGLGRPAAPYLRLAGIDGQGIAGGAEGGAAHLAGYLLELHGAVEGKFCPRGVEHVAAGPRGGLLVVVTLFDVAAAACPGTLHRNADEALHEAGFRRSLTTVEDGLQAVSRHELAEAAHGLDGKRGEVDAD